MNKLNLSTLSIGELSQVFIDISQQARNSSVDHNLQLCNILYKYSSKVPQFKEEAGPSNAIISRFSSGKTNGVVQIINGNANINSSHNSHLRCLLSYAIQFRLAGQDVHLVVLNFPSIANVRFWCLTKRFAYINYINNFISENSDFNPYSSISIICDHDDADLNLPDYISKLKYATHILYGEARLLMGMSGGGPNLLGSHGLEWLESILKDVSGRNQSTLMCHMYDNINFVSHNKLLSMSSLMTKNYLKKKDPASSFYVCQSSMIDPRLFKKKKSIVSTHLSKNELMFLEKLRSLPRELPKLLIAGPWLEKKWNAKVINHSLNKVFSVADTIPDLFDEFPELHLVVVGSESSFILTQLNLTVSRITAIKQSENFSYLLDYISSCIESVVATFTPNHGNGSTNSEVANSGIPSIFLAPSDSQSMLPSCCFTDDLQTYKNNIRSLLTDSAFRASYLQEFLNSQTQFTKDTISHANSLL